MRVCVLLLCFGDPGLGEGREDSPWTPDTGHVFIMSGLKRRDCEKVEGLWGRTQISHLLRFCLLSCNGTRTAFLNLSLLSQQPNITACSPMPIQSSGEMLLLYEWLLLHATPVMSMVFLFLLPLILTIQNVLEKKLIN